VGSTSSIGIEGSTSSIGIEGSTSTGIVISAAAPPLASAAVASRVMLHAHFACRFTPSNSEQ
jgi:hypothetical protein